MPVVSQFELSREPVKLEDQKDFIFKHFDGDGKLKFSIILNKLDTRMKIVVTFLAVLDLVREGLCILTKKSFWRIRAAESYYCLINYERKRIR